MTKQWVALHFHSSKTGEYAACSPLKWVIATHEILTDEQRDFAYGAGSYSGHGRAQPYARVITENGRMYDCAAGAGYDVVILDAPVVCVPTADAAPTQTVTSSVGGWGVT